MFKFTAVILSVGALAAAQSLSDLTPSCNQAVTALASNAEVNNCTNVNGLLNLLLTPANSSLIPGIDSFLHGFCAAPDCSAATITGVAANLTTACAQDLASIGVTAADGQQIGAIVQQFFPLVKDVACLSDSSANQFCLTEVLTNVQSFFGQPLSIATLENTLPQLVGQAIQTGGSSVQIPANITCTPCVQAAYVLLKDALPNQVNGTDEKNAIIAQCGAAFEAADAMPSGIVEGTGTNGPSASKPNSARSTAVAGAGALLFAIAGAFVAIA